MLNDITPILRTTWYYFKKANPKTLSEMFDCFI